MSKTSLDFGFFCDVNRQNVEARSLPFSFLHCRSGGFCSLMFCCVMQTFHVLQCSSQFFFFFLPSSLNIASLDSQVEDNCKIVFVELPNQEDTLIWVGRSRQHLNCLLLNSFKPSNAGYQSVYYGISNTRPT